MTRASCSLILILVVVSWKSMRPKLQAVTRSIPTELRRDVGRGSATTHGNSGCLYSPGHSICALHPQLTILNGKIPNIFHGPLPICNHAKCREHWREHRRYRLQNPCPIVELQVWRKRLMFWVGQGFWNQDTLAGMTPRFLSNIRINYRLLILGDIA